MELAIQTDIIEQYLQEIEKLGDNALTGRYYHKQTFFGAVLMVEYKSTIVDGLVRLPITYWRKGKLSDLETLKMQ